MYTLIKISCSTNPYENCINFCKVEEAIQFINSNQFKIIETVLDSAGNITAFLCENPN